MAENQPNIQIITGSRLHFGLTMVGHRQPGMIGGMGVMIESPRTRVTVRAARQFSVKRCARARALVDRWRQAQRLAMPLACTVEVHDKPRPHTGLGSGTQLSLAIAEGLRHFAIASDLASDDNEVTPAQVACQMHRGRRGLVGTYGFFHGGLIVDEVPRGYQRQESHFHRMDIPHQWRIVLVCCRGRTGQFGAAESTSFRRLAAASDKNCQRMNQLVLREILPAVADQDFHSFSTGISEFGALSGEYFSSIQGGIYNGQDLAEVVAAFQKLGISGTGQSSWGPTVFGWCENQDQANQIARTLMDQFRNQADVAVTSPRNRGYSIVSRSASEGLIENASFARHH